MAVNGRAAVRRQIGGVERLATEMAVRLPEVRPERYGLIAPRPQLAHRAGQAWEQAVLPLRARAYALIYSPANLAPLASNRNVVVIHDLAVWRHPEAYSRPYVSYQRLVLPLLAGRARRLITVSEFSKRELVDVLGLNPEQIEVVPLGVDQRFSPDTDPSPAIDFYGLERPYVLVVGTPSARKNLAALARVRRSLQGQGVDLVLAGSGRPYLRGGEASPRRLGYVPESILPSLYAGARALLVPSRYEGFGLPCLEAMASGVPVVCYRTAALPETCGQAALLVDSGQDEALVQAALSAACDEPTRARLSSAGRARAASFSWERTADLTDRAIERALAQL